MKAPLRAKHIVILKQTLPPPPHTPLPPSQQQEQPFKERAIKERLVRCHGAGGLEKHTWALIGALRAQGARVSLICSHPCKDPLLLKELKECDPLGFSWYSTDSRSNERRVAHHQLLHYDAQSQHLIASLQPDLVLGLERHSSQHYWRAGGGLHRAWLDLKPYPCGALGRLFGPLVDRLRPLQRAMVHLEEHAIKSSQLKKVIVNSCLVAEQLSYYYRLAPEKILLIPNGAPLEASQPFFEEKITQGASKAQRALGLDEELHQVLFVGNGYRRKGLALVLSSLRAIMHHPWQLHIVGKESRLEQWRAKERLFPPGKVKFWGYRDDLFPFYAACHTLISPSFYDPCANVVPEALSFGLQVLTSSTNGAKQYLPPGMIFDLFSPQECREKITRALLRKPTAIDLSKQRALVASLGWKKQIAQLVGELTEAF